MLSDKKAIDAILGKELTHSLTHSLDGIAGGKWHSMLLQNISQSSLS